MDAAPLSALDLPLKVLVWADRDQTKVSYLSPGAFVDRYSVDPDLAYNLAGIDGLTDALVSSRFRASRAPGRAEPFAPTRRSGTRSGRPRLRSW